MACVLEWSGNKAKSPEYCLSEKIWFIDTHTIPSVDPDCSETRSGTSSKRVGTNYNICFAECAAAIWFLYVAPGIPTLWADMNHSTHPMTYPTFCQLFKEVLKGTIKANKGRDPKGN